MGGYFATVNREDTKSFQALFSAAVGVPNPEGIEGCAYFGLFGVLKMLRQRMASILRKEICKRGEESEGHRLFRRYFLSGNSSDSVSGDTSHVRK